MNQCLKEINTDTAYKAPQPIPIPPGTRIPVIEVHTVVLSREEAHNLWSWWAFLLDVHRFLPAPHSGDQEAVQSFIAATSLSVKLANVTPIQKESPLTNFNHLRPLSLTKIITRLFQKLVLKFELPEVLKSLMRPDQFAYKEECKTTRALVKSQHYWLKWVDREADFVRVLSCNFFSKAFDTVPHAWSY